MPLSWNEIKSRATIFSRNWADAGNEDSQAKPFLIDFFERTDASVSGASITGLFLSFGLSPLNQTGFMFIGEIFIVGHDPDTVIVRTVLLDFIFYGECQYALL